MGKNFGFQRFLGQRLLAVSSRNSRNRCALRKTVPSELQAPKEPRLEEPREEPEEREGVAGWVRGKPHQAVPKVSQKDHGGSLCFLVHQEV